MNARRAGTRGLPAVPPIAGAMRIDGIQHASSEALAGVTLVALAVPMNIGYASVAGLPATVGIYASILPVAVFAVTTGSRRLVVGPDATVAALLAAAVMPLAATGVAATEAAIGVALLTGAVLAVGWLVGLGRVVRFLSHAVLLGFIAGLAVEILTAQIRRMMAVEVEAEGWVREVIALISAVPEASRASVVVGVSTIVIVRTLRRRAPRVPGALIALVVVGGVVAWRRPDGVAVLGPVPSGLPSPTFPTLPLDAWLALFPVALAIALLTVAEGLSISQSAARRHGESIEPNGEVLAYGLANAAAACSGGMPVGASASRTAALEDTGASTQVPMVVAAVVAAVLAVAFTDVLAAIPMAALGGLVANAVLGLINVPAFARLARLRRSEFVIALLCALGVLILGPLPGLALAAVTSAVDVVRRAAELPWSRLDEVAEPDDTSRFVGGHGQRTGPGLLVLRPEGPLFFANAQVIHDQLDAVAHDRAVRWLVLDLEAVSDIDPTAAEALTDALAEVQRAGTVVALSRVRAPIRALLDRYGVTDELDPGRVYPSNRAATAAYRSAPRTRPVGGAADERSRG